MMNKTKKNKSEASLSLSLSLVYLFLYVLFTIWILVYVQEAIIGRTDECKRQNESISIEYTSTAASLFLWLHVICI